MDTDPRDGVTVEYVVIGVFGLNRGAINNIHVTITGKIKSNASNYQSGAVTQTNYAEGSITNPVVTILKDAGLFGKDPPAHGNWNMHASAGEVVGYLQSGDFGGNLSVRIDGTVSQQTTKGCFGGVIGEGNYRGIIPILVTVGPKAEKFGGKVSLFLGDKKPSNAQLQKWVSAVPYNSPFQAIVNDLSGNSLGISPPDAICC